MVEAACVQDPGLPVGLLVNSRSLTHTHTHWCPRWQPCRFPNLSVSHLFSIVQVNPGSHSQTLWHNRLAYTYTHMLKKTKNRLDNIFLDWEHRWKELPLFSRIFFNFLIFFKFSIWFSPDFSLLQLSVFLILFYTFGFYLREAAGSICRLVSSLRFEISFGSF